MTDLTSTLEQILNWLQNNKPDYALSLQDGLTRSEIDIVSQELAFQLPEEIYELFQWKNGSQEVLNAPFSPSPSFLTLENAVELADWYSNDPDLGGIRYKGKRLFPFLGQHKAHFAIVIDTNSESSYVVLTDSEQDEGKLVSLTINRLLITALECCRAGLFHLDDCDEIDRISGRISSIYNPEIVNEALGIVLETETQHLEDEHCYSRFIDACDTLVYFKDRRAIEPLIILSNNCAHDKFTFSLINSIIRGISR